MEMHLEVVVVPVADVDRAKDFYKELGWRLDADFSSSPDFRVVQLDAARLRVLGDLRHRRHRGRARIA